MRRVWLVYGSGAIVAVTMSMLINRCGSARRNVLKNEVVAICQLHPYILWQDNYREGQLKETGLAQYSSSLRELLESGEATESFARAEADAPACVAYAGYVFRILKRQGPNAPGGRMDYIVNGRMTAGHAIIAFPREYGTTGVHTYVAVASGVVWEADLGIDTNSGAMSMEEFDPDARWTRLEENVKE